MSEKSAGKSSNDSQSEHEDENVDEKYGEDAPLLEEKQSQLRINEIHTLKVGRQQLKLRMAKMIKTSEKLAEDQTKLLLTATELENEDDSPPSEGEDKQKYEEAMQASAELSAKLTAIYEKLSAAKIKFKDLTAMLARLLDVPINQVDNLAYIGVHPDLSTGSGSSTSGEDDLDSTVHEDFPNVDPSRIIFKGFIPIGKIRDLDTGEQMLDALQKQGVKSVLLGQKPIAFAGAALSAPQTSIVAAAAATTTSTPTTAATVPSAAGEAPANTAPPSSSPGGGAGQGTDSTSGGVSQQGFSYGAATDDELIAQQLTNVQAMDM